jgi:hypothetical protein
MNELQQLILELQELIQTSRDDIANKKDMDTVNVTNEMVEAAQAELSNLIGDSDLELSYIKAAIEAALQVAELNKGE